jgi:hypothetical protein
MRNCSTDLPIGRGQTILSAQSQSRDKAETDRIVCPTLRIKFEELYAPSHPLRAALHKLNDVDSIKVIEGRA